MMMLHAVQVVCRERGKRACVASQTITNRLGVADAVALKLEHPASRTAGSRIAIDRNSGFPFPEASRHVAIMRTAIALVVAAALLAICQADTVRFHLIRDKGRMYDVDVIKYVFSCLLPAWQ